MVNHPAAFLLLLYFNSTVLSNYALKKSAEPV